VALDGASPVFTMRDIAERDIEALDAMLQAAYGTSRSLAARLRAAMIGGAARTVVTEVDGAPVGMATLHDYRAVAYVALVGVHPAYQKRGIARRLMDELIAEAGARGIAEIALESSAAGEALYRSLGFVQHGATLVYTGSATASSPSAAGHAETLPRGVARATERDYAAIIDCDRRVFRADRAPLLGQRLREPDALFFIARSADGVAGFAERRADLIGPWIAESADAAERVLDAAIGAGPGDVRVLVPSDNAHARTLLAARGWAEFRRNAHLVRGGSLHANRSAIHGLISLGEG
jgi:ribosomal protein S18 acetylase RimI-like enzyme